MPDLLVILDFITRTVSVEQIIKLLITWFSQLPNIHASLFVFLGKIYLLLFVTLPTIPLEFSTGY
jgi:hypothetical protein